VFLCASKVPVKVASELEVRRVEKGLLLFLWVNECFYIFLSKQQR
jgi:hypothetical protein